MRTAYTVAVFLLACSCLGGTINSLDPASIRVQSGEYFVRINGSSLSGNVVFDGPAGQFELETNAIGPGYVIAWIPMEVVNNSGSYKVMVGDSNTASLSIVKPGRPGLKLHLPELLLALAKTRLGTRIDYEISASGEYSSVDIKCDPPSGSTFPFGQSRIKCVATDDLGDRDTGEIDVNVWDGAAPVLELPKSFEVEADDERGAFVKYDTRAYDEIDGDLGAKCFPESGSLFRPGRTIVNCEATDASLNPAYGAFDVFVRPRDIGRLELKVPEKVYEAATDKYGAELSFEVIAYGSADPDPVVECTPPGMYFPIGVTKVYCVATDDFDQRAEAGFTVEVVERLGLKLPDVTAEATSPAGTEVTWEALDEDWTSPITCSPGSGSLFTLGATAVECESVDDRGRRAGGTFKVNVADTIAPHIGRIHTTAGTASGDMVPVQVAIEAIDTADAMPLCSVSALTDDGGGALDGRVLGDLAVEVRAGASRSGRIHVSCVDASGNRSTASVALTGGMGRTRVAN